MRAEITYCVTDNEIYDLFMSSKKKLPESSLHKLANARGIFYSSEEDREELADSLSLLPHDFYDLERVKDETDHASRPEKTTYITINGDITIDDIKAATSTYGTNARPDEKIIGRPAGENRYTTKLEYSEIDHSKTKLIQRKEKEADIEFSVEDGRTLIRFPANERAKSTVSAIKEEIERKKHCALDGREIDLSDFPNPKQRTEFFTGLITSMPGLDLHNVTSLNVEPIKADQTDDDDEIALEDDQELEEAKREALGAVIEVAFKGDSLLQSEEYKSFHQKGFFITSIIWRSRESNSPYNIIEFSASFGDPLAGRDFKYSVRGMFKNKKGEYNKTLSKIPDNDRRDYLSILERTAESALDKLSATTDASDTEPTISSSTSR